MVVPGMLNRDMDTNWNIAHLLIGGPEETLRAWVGQVHARVEIGAREIFNMPLWNPPNAVLTPAEVRALSKGAESPEHGSAVGNVPDDWRFLAWRVDPMWAVYSRQNFSVKFTGEVPGTVRVILGGALTAHKEYNGDSAKQFVLHDAVTAKDPVAFTQKNIGDTSTCNAVVPGCLYGDDGVTEVTDFLIGTPSGRFASGVLEVDGKPYSGTIDLGTSDEFNPLSGWHFRRYHFARTLILEGAVPLRVRVSGLKPGEEARVIIKGAATRPVI